jgi:hypothetical protein
VTLARSIHRAAVDDLLARANGFDRAARVFAASRKLPRGRGKSILAIDGGNHPAAQQRGPVGGVVAGRFAWPFAPGRIRWKVDLHVVATTHKLGGILSAARWQVSKGDRTAGGIADQVRDRVALGIHELADRSLRFIGVAGGVDHRHGVYPRFTGAVGLRSGVARRLHGQTVSAAAGGQQGKHHDHRRERAGRGLGQRRMHGEATSSLGDPSQVASSLMRRWHRSQQVPG